MACSLNRFNTKDGQYLNSSKIEDLQFGYKVVWYISDPKHFDDFVSGRPTAWAEKPAPKEMKVTPAAAGVEPVFGKAQSEPAPTPELTPAANQVWLSRF